MEAGTGPTTVDAGSRLNLATFHVGDLLIGIDIVHIQEINRQLDLTIVPCAPAVVRGVVNLRGDVVTVLDLRRILQMEQVEFTRHSRNVIVNVAGERVGLLVDRAADAIAASAEHIEPPPASISGAHRQFFKAVGKLDGRLLAILDVEAAVQVGRDEQSELVAPGPTPVW